MSNDAATWQQTVKFSIVALLGAILTAVATYITYQRDVEQALVQLSMDANDYAGALTLETDRSLTVLKALASLHGAPFSSQALFYAISPEAIAQYQQLQALAWVPLIASQQREAFEATASLQHPGFTISQYADGAFIPSQHKAHYLPLAYYVGQLSRCLQPGVDLLDSKLHKQLARIVAQGEPALVVDMLPIFERGEAKKNHTMIALMPVYHGLPDSPLARHNQFKGFLLALIRIDRLATEPVGQERLRYVDLSILDVTHDKQWLVVSLQDNENGGKGIEQYEHSKDFSVLGERVWQLTAMPSREYLAMTMRQDWRYVLSIGGLLTLMLLVFVYYVAQRRRVIERQVERQTAELRMANHKLEQLSRTDALTSLANRRYFDEYLTAEWQRAKRDKTAFSLILCDVDCFKSYNDRYGHPAGDRCLQQVALALRGCFSRPADLVARYGGEEFAVVLPATELNELGVLEYCRKTVADLQIPHEGSTVADHVTISLGACTVIPAESSDDFESALKSADQALYRAKLEGRNQAVLFASGH